MSSDVGSNTRASAPAESKSARKKKAKAEAAGAAAQTQDKSCTQDASTSTEQASKTNGAESSGENAFVKELQKSIRNVNKKLNLMQKVDTVIAENPDVSLDDLVASRKINADQKAQALKKPALQSQLAQLEEQLTQYKKFDQEYQQKIAHEKEALEQAHSEELSKLRDSLKAEAIIESRRLVKEKLLTFSRFLRAAAARRQQEDEQENEITKAFEGALLQVYGGDAAAVLAAEKLIEGSDDSVPSTEGETLNVTYAQVKQAALEDFPFAAEEAWVDDVAQQSQAPPPYSSEAPGAPATDPTVAHAGLTEINTVPSGANGNGDSVDPPNAPAASSVGGDAANPAAEAQWDKQTAGADDPLAESFEIVPRDPVETATPRAAAPNNSTQSWADDAPEAASAPTAPSAPTNNTDGFHEVHHSRGGRGRGGHQGEGRGGFRGRGGPRGEGRGGRGRGGRGDFRGRGRGGFRGDRGGSRGDSQ